MNSDVVRFVLDPEASPARSPRPRSRRKGRPVLLVVAALALAGGVGLYLHPGARAGLQSLTDGLGAHLAPGPEGAEGATGMLLPASPPGAEDAEPLAPQSQPRGSQGAHASADAHAPLAAETAALAAGKDAPEGKNHVRGAGAGVVDDTTPAALAATRTLRQIDGLIRERDLDAARTRLAAFVEQSDPPDRFIADGYYRLGLIARLQKREPDAVGNWDRAFRTFPDTPGGRMAALALADTRYARACGKQPDYDEWEGVRDLYSAALGTDGAPFITDDATRARTLQHLARLNERLVFSPAPTSNAVFYNVRGGDMLYTIARKHQVHFDSIARINNIHPDRLRKGRKLKILKADCSIVIDKSELTLTWYLDGKWVKRYQCCVGPANKTPAGTYTITRKDTKPAWRNPADGKLYAYGDPDNILGTRWMALEGGDTTGLGIHGTTKPESIPGRASNGCVRLRNEDVEELYAFALIGTPVFIRE